MNLNAKKWLVLPRLEIRSANSQPAWWCVGAPGPMAARGMAEALASFAMSSPSSLLAVGLVYHDYRHRAESFDPFTIYPHQHRGAALINKDDYAQGSKSLSGQPTVRGDGVVTIILELDAQAEVDLDKVRDFLGRGRFAGGAIISHAMGRDKSPIKMDWSQVQAVVKSGMAFCDRTDLITRLMADSHGAMDPLDAFIEATRRRKLKPKTAQERRGDAAEASASTAEIPEPTNGWLMPYLAGFRNLTPVQDRVWSRDGLPHAFVEPLVGLGQLVSVRGGSIAMWDYVRGEFDSYLIKQTHVEIPASDSLADDDMELVDTHALTI